MTSKTDRRLKLIVPLWKDPVGWSRRIGVSSTVWFFLYILSAGWGFWSVYTSIIVNTDLDPQLVLVILVAGFSPVILYGVIILTIYAYAIYRLLKIVDEGKGT